jgi:hypothetical protein
MSEFLKLGIYTQPKYQKRQVITDEEIDGIIIDTSGFVVSYLQRLSGGVTGLYAASPYFKKPVHNFNNVAQRNEDQPRLRGVTVASAAITEQWTVRFTETNAFSLLGSISGPQGSAFVTTTNSLATDGDVTIPSAAWYYPNTDIKFEQNDRIYFSTEKADAGILKVTALLACADVIDRFYSEAAPNESRHGQRMRAQAMKFLDAVVAGDILLTGMSVDPDNDFTEIPYDVTALGEDVSPYLWPTGDDMKDEQFGGTSRNG